MLFSCVPNEKVEKKQNNTNELVLFLGTYPQQQFEAAVSIFKESFPDVNLVIYDFGSTVSMDIQVSFDSILYTDIMGGKGPDVILWDMSRDTFDDIVKTMEADVFCNLDVYISNDTNINTTDYVESVTNAGVYKGQRLLIPLDYCVPLLLTTEEAFSSWNVSPPENLDFNSFISMFRQACNYAEAYENKWSVYGTLLPYSLSTSGFSFIDYSRSDIDINEVELKHFIDAYKPQYLLFSSRTIFPTFPNNFDELPLRIVNGDLLLIKPIKMYESICYYGLLAEN